MKTALITGICGFVGSSVAIKLVEKGIQVIGVDLSDKPKNKKLADLIADGRVKIWKGDLNSFDFSSLERVDYVFQIAGKVSPWGDIRGFDKINVEGTKRVIDYAHQEGVSSFLYLSSVAVYGFGGYVDLTEEAPKNPFDNPYSISKLRAETMVVEECKKIGLPYVIIRPGNVYGPYDYTSSTHIYSKIEAGNMPYVDKGKYKSCFVYVDNLAEAIVTAGITDKAWNQDFNITDGFGETLDDYFSLVAKEMVVKNKFISIKAPLAKTVAALVEGFYKLLKIKKAPLITKFSTYQNCVDYHFSIEKARNVLGFSPNVTLEEGVKRTVEWYKTLKD
ncbi:MAG: 3 beta-hydroxysteroid dehydrogenase/Delta 5--_4-isomerase [Firmicutes bacterium ADurb.Bin080]|nr:NAD(P)-dependent oxidoreductase [Clostridiales bacterium]OQC12362.1 MAG: 3 beta-hydroxysteroid dehydrogenase/Delta 5-->4-isomerase [Firmicutes bacterium ADurb.Bin080]